MAWWAIFLIVYGAINLIVGTAALLKVTFDPFGDYLCWLFPIPGSLYLLCDGYIDRPAMFTLQIIATIILREKFWTDEGYTIQEYHEPILGRD